MWEDTTSFIPTCYGWTKGKSTDTPCAKKRKKSDFFKISKWVKMVPKDLKGLKKGFIKDQGVLQMVKVKLSWKVLLNYCCFFVAPSLSYRFYVLQIQTPPLVVERQMNATKVFSHNSENNTVVFILVNKYKALYSTICFAIQNKKVTSFIFLKRLFNPSIQVLLAISLVLVACLVKCQVVIFLKCCQN